MSVRNLFFRSPGTVVQRAIDEGFYTFEPLTEKQRENLCDPFYEGRKSINYMCISIDYMQCLNALEKWNTKRVISKEIDGSVSLTGYLIGKNTSSYQENLIVLKKEFWNNFMAKHK